MYIHPGQNTCGVAKLAPFRVYLTHRVGVWTTCPNSTVKLWLSSSTTAKARVKYADSRARTGRLEDLQVNGEVRNRGAYYRELPMAHFTCSSFSVSPTGRHIATCPVVSYTSSVPNTANPSIFEHSPPLYARCRFSLTAASRTSLCTQMPQTTQTGATSRGLLMSSRSVHALYEVVVRFRR